MEPKELFERHTLERLDDPEPSPRALADGIKLIAGRLWTKEEMIEFIDRRHNHLCAQCPAIAVKPRRAEESTGGESINMKLVGIIGTVCAALASIATAIVTHFTTKG